MKPLFIAGSPRSGTTALADYLNQHESILICRERYKYGPGRITSELFTFDRILDYGENETNIPREYHLDLIGKKDPAKVEWIGDKLPAYVKRLKRLHRYNPGAHFIITYRPVEEVAESFQARADDPGDKWPSSNGFEQGVELWNSALRYTRDFVESVRDPKLLVLGYHDFFNWNEASIRLISQFLDVEFDEAVRENWMASSREFEKERQRKAPLDEKQLAYVEENKDHAAEKWILDLIDKQWSEPDQASESEPAQWVPGKKGMQIELEEQLRDARQRARRLRKRNQRLTRQVRDLNRQVQSMRNSKIVRLSNKLGAVSARVLNKTAAMLPKSEPPPATGDAPLQLDGYDFLDFGASKGASITFGVRRLGGTRGLGIDIDSNKVDLMKSKGFDCIEADATQLGFPPDSVRFVVMSHFLEHLPNLQAVEDSIKSAAHIASDFLFIQGPYFDADEFLESRGLKFYWSDWHGYPFHLTTYQLRDILSGLGLHDYVMMGCEEVTSSADPAVHPLSSPVDQHAYDPEIHPAKPFVEFDHPLYSSIVCCVRLGEVENWESILETRKGCRRLETSAEEQPAGSLKTPGRGIPPANAIVPPEQSGATEAHMKAIITRLMLVRRWSYLRYLHMREGLYQAEGVESVLAVGCGRGYAEVALALEFPEIHFHLTDIESERTPNYYNAQKLVESWGLKNVTFGIRDILAPQPDRYELVASVEVLEHIENDVLAAERMNEAADKYVFALIPFADKAANSNEALRAKVYENHEHCRVGYDEDDLRTLFPDIVAVRGCYWKERGGKLREELNNMSDGEIKARLAELQAAAQEDIVDAVPADLSEALGIWMLAKV
jgi:SAM-dependent methyltransferase